MIWLAWGRDRHEAQAALSDRRERAAAAAARVLAHLARLPRRALSVFLSGLPAAAYLCPGHSDHPLRRLKTSLADLPEPQGPPPGHPERLLGADSLSIDELLWLAELLSDPAEPEGCSGS